VFCAYNDRKLNQALQSTSTPKGLSLKKFKSQNKLTVRKQSRIKTTFAGGTPVVPSSLS
jgi:hypothetical protein